MGKAAAIGRLLAEWINRAENARRTRRDVALAAGISPTYLSALLTGTKKGASADTITRLAEVLAPNPEDRLHLLQELRPFTTHSRRPSHGTAATTMSTLEKIDRSGSFTAGVVSYSPFARLGKGHDPAGYVIDIFQEIKALAHFTYDVVPTFWDKMHLDLAAGRIDVVLSGVFATLARLPRMVFVPLPYFDPDEKSLHEILGRMAVVAREDTADGLSQTIAAQELEEKLAGRHSRTPGLKAGVFPGEFGEDICAIFLPQARRIHLAGPGTEDAIKQLSAGDIDLIVCDGLSARTIVSQNTGLLLRKIDIDFRTADYSRRTYYEPIVGLAVRRSDTEWRTFLEDAVRTVVFSPAPSMRTSLRRHRLQLTPFLVKYHSSDPARSGSAPTIEVPARPPSTKSKETRT